MSVNWMVGLCFGEGGGLSVEVLLGFVGVTGGEAVGAWIGRRYKKMLNNQVLDRWLFTRSISPSSRFKVCISSARLS